MWDFLREQIDRIPTPVRIYFVLALALAAINRITGLDFPTELRQCSSNLHAVQCIGLGIASIPYVILGMGLLYFIVTRVIAGIRRRLSSGRGEKPFEGH